MRSNTEHSVPTLVRGLGLVAATAIVVAEVIGTGVFLKARVMTCNVEFPSMVIAVWIAAGLLAMAGALTYGELTAMLPRAGGVYVFLREAYGDGVAFVFGWVFVLVTTPATVAALATVFGEFLLNLLGRPPSTVTIQVIAIAAILTLTLANLLGARVGSSVGSSYARPRKST